LTLMKRTVQPFQTARGKKQETIEKLMRD
jgi:hypothetical protein